MPDAANRPQARYALADLHRLRVSSSSNSTSAQCSATYTTAVDTIAGLPAHPLLVHAAVVLVPFAAVVAIVAVLWPRARRWLGLTPPIAALVALIVVPITTSAGEALEKTVPATPTLSEHTHDGDQLILWVGPLFGLVALWWLLTSAAVAAYRDRWLGVRAQRWLQIAVAVATVAVAVGTIVMVVRIGDLGARAVWGG